MMRRTILIGLCIVVAGGTLLSSSRVASAQGIQPSGIRQIQEILREKARRTRVQQKLDSHIHLAGQVAKGVLNAQGRPWLADARKQLEFDAKGRIHVDIRGTVTPGLLGLIAALRGTVESSHPEYEAIRAWIPLRDAERLAARPEVTFIAAAARAIYSGPGEESLSRDFLSQPGAPRRGQLYSLLPLLAPPRAFAYQGMITNSAPVDTKALVSEGADLVQNLGFTGSGVKVAVLSDGVDSLATLQGVGDLPPVAVLSGQAGSGDEGTAMLEIVYDLAPGAELYFATAAGGPTQMASNILNLAALGCQIIVDDVSYLTEGVFQDDIIARAVNQVTADGVLYFSSAANSGNLDSGTSGTWEGDFNGTGGAISVINTYEGKTVTVHAFDGSHNYDSVTYAGGNPVSLKWSDPLGASCNDYDLFVMDSNLTTILKASTSAQFCTEDPFEYVTAPALGNRLVVVLYYGSTRALHLDTSRSQIAINTSGSTSGHNAAATAVTVAATPAQSSIFTAGNQSPETYSSDGPRKIFYNPDGTPITADNFLFATNGGTTLAKVDLTTADCGQSAVSGFDPFCGTSAAAPTAAAIAALVWSADPTLTPSQVLNAMKSTALAAHAGFGTRTVGAGIAMANLSVNSVLHPGTSFTPPSIFFGTQPKGVNSSSRTVTLTNPGNASLTINSYVIASGNSADFSVTTNCGGTLAAGNSCNFFTYFNPTAIGPRKAYLTVSDNAAGSPHKVMLTGVGTAAAVSPASLSFANQTVNTSSSPQTVTLTNSSSATMHIWQIAILGTNAADFSKTTTCGSTLAAGANCTVSVTFRPTATGARTASLLFSDDGAGSPQAVTLSGTGI